MKFDNTILSDFDRAHSLEWIETNGLGGYASGTASGAHSRKYHGLLVAALQPPVGRTVLLSKLEETIVIGEVDAAGQTTRHELGANQYPGALHPHGYKYLKQFSKDIFPVFYYEAGGVSLQKTIVAVQQENTTLILYEILDANATITLELLPLYAARDHHCLSHANDVIGKQYLFDEGIFRTLNYQGGTEVFIGVPRSQFTEQQNWYYNLEYSLEQNRGLDFKEDLYSHGKFSVKMKKGDTLGVIVSTEDPKGRSAFKMLSIEKKRREKLVKEFSWNSDIRRLVMAADQFIVKRASLSTIIAGYHWFADWGRDTMISLPGLCLVTGRYKEAKQILQQFAGSVSEGMLPNRFPDHGEVPEYNGIDSTLWFFHAIHQYYIHTRDKTFIKSVLPVLHDIIALHYKGTRYNIRVDPTDELLSGGQDGIQLTWMDAKAGEWVVTPRRGKAVEVNALWYNALRTMEALSGEFQKGSDSKEYGEKALRVYNSFNEKFWNEGAQCLFDLIDGELRDDNLRPNQLYAISLPYPLIAGVKAKSILGIVKEYLLTPKGLRSLDAKHREYKAHYAGDVWTRDGAYHQGTVWSFLLGPYIDALFHVNPNDAHDGAVSIITTFLKHLDEAGVGTISEIFDAEPPHKPRGCIAQAWGVGEVLRVILQHKLLPAPERISASAESLVL